MDDLVSIIIPIYNSEKYLKQCLQSIKDQSYKKLEIILIDDGSTDSSGEICDQHAKEDPRCKVQHIKNQGVSNARNCGIKIAVGTYMMFVDSDDWIPVDYVENLMKAMKKGNYDLTACPIYGQIKEEWKDFSFDFSQYDSDKFLFLSENYFLYGPVCKIYLAKIIKENQISFPKEISYGEDLIFNVEYLKKCQKIFITNQTFYNYRLENEDSLSRKYREDQFEMEKVLSDKLFELVKIKGIKDENLEKYYYRRYVDSAYNIILKNEKKSFLQKYRFIKNILNDAMLEVALKKGDTDGYSKKILNLMKRRNSIILTMIAMRA